MHLVLHLTPSTLTFTQPTSGGAYPLLLGVGVLRLAARTGEASSLGGNESPNVQVTLDNRNRRAATIVGRPLRALAEIYDDAGDLFFSGTVSGCSYGRTVTLEVDA